jgi:uncharacterized protein
VTDTAADPLAGLPEEGREFFEAVARGELAVQRCSACGLLRHYPRPHCPSCLSPEWTWQACSGKGTVYTFTVIRQNGNPRFRERLPYVVAVVELDEGVRMLTNVVGCDVDEVRVGMPVAAVFEQDPDGRTVPRFTPA